MSAATIRASSTACFPSPQDHPSSAAAVRLLFKPGYLHVDANVGLLRGRFAGGASRPTRSAQRRRCTPRPDWVPRQRDADSGGWRENRRSPNGLGNRQVGRSPRPAPYGGSTCAATSRGTTAAGTAGGEQTIEDRRPVRSDPKQHFLTSNRRRWAAGRLHWNMGSSGGHQRAGRQLSPPRRYPVTQGDPGYAGRSRSSKWKVRALQKSLRTGLRTNSVGDRGAAGNTPAPRCRSASSNNLPRTADGRVINAAPAGLQAVHARRLHLNETIRSNGRTSGVGLGRATNRDGKS